MKCTILEGRVGPEALAAVTEWTEYLTENGSEAGHWLLRPGPGEEPDATYSFKWATAYPSWAHVGHDFEVNNFEHRRQPGGRPGCRTCLGGSSMPVSFGACASPWTPVAGTAQPSLESAGAGPHQPERADHDKRPTLDARPSYSRGHLR